jgi:hypothetical protein
VTISINALVPLVFTRRNLTAGGQCTGARFDHHQAQRSREHLPAPLARAGPNFAATTYTR